MDRPIRPFHLAFPVNNLPETIRFYRDLIGCSIGRSAERWVDFDLFGHQLSAHLSETTSKPVIHNEVDRHSVPVPHFGVVLQWEVWHQLAARLKAQNMEFVIEPYLRFEGLPGEQATMFFLDPSGNALEFKSFKQDEQLFAT
ncbi:MAG: VOC family protein [Salibacteraceae bacterium]